MSDLMNHNRRMTVFVWPALVLGLLGIATITSFGCAQAESRNWAQTSPLIEPEQRAQADFHLSAHDDVPHPADDELHEHDVDG